MASIHKIKPGQVLYDVRRRTRWHSNESKWDVWPVKVEEVNVEGGYIIARWNVVNPPSELRQNSIKKLRVKNPNDAKVR